MFKRIAYQADHRIRQRFEFECAVKSQVEYRQLVISLDDVLRTTERLIYVISFI